MSKHQQKLFNLGLDAKKITGDIGFHDAIGVLVYNDNFEEIVENIQYDNDRHFFEAGFYNYTPQYRQAYRYGNIPASGYSTNWATKELEEGVSCVCLIGNKHQNEESIYDTIYGVQGFKKIKIEGWFLGDAGADGEPLLIQAREVKI